MKKEIKIIVLFLLILLISIMIITLYKVSSYESFTSDYEYLMDKNLVSELNNLYNKDLEYAGCLEGNLQGDNKEIYLYSINNINYGEIDKVNLPLCKSIAVIHSHPSGDCIGKLNVPDTEAAKIEFKNGVSLFIIQCSPNVFEIYTKEDLYQGSTIEI